MGHFLSTQDADFNIIKENLRTWLKNQQVFQDYNFDGPNISVLIDLLAYNTYMNAFYLNMASNERFIDTAVLRDSVASHGKHLNYVPRSYTSATSTLTIEIVPTNNAVGFITIPKYTKFVCSVSNNNFVFSTNNDIVINKNANNEFVGNVAIYEGTIISERFVANNHSNNSIFSLSNPQIDLGSLAVSVTTANNANSVTYTKVDSLYGLQSNSTIYFVQAGLANNYQIVFGDDIFGRKLIEGDTVFATYRISSGEGPNGASAFSPQLPVGVTSLIIIDATTSEGGSTSEDIDSIRFNAPRHFQVQERAVTNEDYKSLLKENFADIKDLNVYGGEEQPNLVQFGKVFISISTQTGNPLTSRKKSEIINFLRGRRVLSINPEIIEPDYLYILVNSIVYYDTTRSSLSSTQIQSLVIDEIVQYNDDNLEIFGGQFKYSKFTKAIDDTDENITGNDTEIELKKIVIPILNQRTTFSVDFSNQLDLGDVFTITNITEHLNNHTPIVSSSKFTVDTTDCYIQDATDGTLLLYTNTSTGKVLINRNIGTIDYTTGIINIVDINIESFEGEGINFYARPKYKNISTNRNNILLIDTDDLNISVVGTSG